MGPEVLNGWKVELLTQFYQRALKHLTGEDPIASDEDWAKLQRQAVCSCLGPTANAYHDTVKSLPLTYMRGTPPDQIADALQRLQGLDQEEVIAWGV